MSELHFIDIDPAVIYNQIMGILEENVGEALYPGDERLIYGEALVAVAVAIFNSVDDRCRQRLIRYSRGPVLDALGERLKTPRLTPNKAKTTMRFTATQPAIHNNIIPAGTRVTADSELFFCVESTVILPAGESFVDIKVLAQEGGSKYNGYAANTITTLVDQLPFIKTVSNVDTSNGGDDGEPYTTEGDDRYRERILLAPETLSAAGTEGRYEYYALSADPSIIDVKVISPEPGKVTLVPLLADGEIPDQEMLNKVLAVVGSREVRAFTDYVAVEAPTVETYDIEIKYFTTNKDQSAVVEMVEGNGGAIDKYIAWQSCGLGREINPDKLRSLILAPNWQEGLIGASRVDIIKPTFKEISETAVAKFSGSLIVNVVVKG